MKASKILILFVITTTFAINVSCKKKDITLPIITLMGSSSMTWCNGVPFVEPGYSAADPEDGDITANVIINNTVNVNVNGTYTITYNVSDKAGNDAEEVARTVTVINCK